MTVRRGGMDGGRLPLGSMGPATAPGTVGRCINGPPSEVAGADSFDPNCDAICGANGEAVCGAGVCLRGWLAAKGLNIRLGADPQKIRLLKMMVLMAFLLRAFAANGIANGMMSPMKLWMNLLGVNFVAYR